MYWWFWSIYAPKDGREFEVLTGEGKILRIHWAQDLSGEEQPPFIGWFTPVEDGNGKVLYYR